MQCRWVRSPGLAEDWSGILIQQSSPRLKHGNAGGDYLSGAAMHGRSDKAFLSDKHAKGTKSALKHPNVQDAVAARTRRGASKDNASADDDNASADGHDEL